MKKQSLAQHNVLILLLSIAPFFLGVGISVYTSSDTAYFSVAINISGSQRMRSMLIANYAQAYQNVEESGKTAEKKQFEDILKREIFRYNRFYRALSYGDFELNLKPNLYEDILFRLESIKEEVDLYVYHTVELFYVAESDSHLNYLIDNSMIMKNHFDEVTNLFQHHNDDLIKSQRIIDIAMISFGAIITMIGLILSVKIKQKEFHAHFDFLTKLKNRHSLFEDMKSYDIEKHSMFFIDLNKFKIINDTFGHNVGDEVLVEVSSRLKNIFDSGLLYRYGGDEFIALVKASEERSMDDLIDEKITVIRQTLSEPIIDSLGRKHFAGLSMGIVSNGVKIENWNELIKLSDDLMYDSKTIAGNAIVYRTRKEVEDRISIIREIDNIFVTGNLSLKFLPVLNCEDDSTSMYNVSSRWKNESNTLKASEFLPILKRKGVLPDLDKNTLKELDRRYLRNHSDGENVTERYLVTLAEDTIKSYRNNGILDVIDELSMPSHLVIIKIEQFLLNDSGIRDFAEQLSRKGFSFAVDNVNLDVSLRERNQLKDVEIIKIGNALTSALMEAENTRLIMSNFIEVFLDNQKLVIVEGIEKNDLMTILSKLPEKTDKAAVLYSSKIME